MTKERSNSDSNEEIDKDTEELLKAHETNIEKLLKQMNKELEGVTNIAYNSLFEDNNINNRNIHVIDPYNCIILLCGTQMVFFVYNNFYTIINLLYVMLLISSGFGIGFVITAYFMKYKNIEEETREEYSQEIKYDLFLNNEYETMKEIFKNEEMMKNEYENSNEGFIKSLTDVSYHFESEIPLEYNNKVVMFYNKEEDAYHYYSKNGDINYKLLNSVCRSYVINYKCLNLFNDDEEIKYIKELIKEETEEQDKNSYEDLSELSNKDEEDKKQEDEEEVEEKRGGLFYFGSNKKQEKKKKVVEKRINKFIHKGNLIDYENKYKKKENNEKKEIDYKEFKKLMDKVTN